MLKKVIYHFLYLYEYIRKTAHFFHTDSTPYHEGRILFKHSLAFPKLF